MSTDLVNEEIDSLRALLGADTDQEFARLLGIERSTIAQWRRRNGVPLRWAVAIKSQSLQSHVDAQRFRIFGAGDGYFLTMAALAIMPKDEFDWDETGLFEAGVGDGRMQKILRATSYVIEHIDGESIDSFAKYEALVRRLSTSEHRERISERLGGRW